MPETKKYYHNLDVDNNKVINPLLNPLTTAQRTAVGTLLGPLDEGYVCFDTTLNQQYFWDGTTWVTVTATTAWGSITGTITAQTDLITYLAANYYPLSSNPAGYLDQTAADLLYYPLLSNPANYIDLTDLSGGTGISYNNLTGVITNSAPDQTVAFTNGTGISVTGTYPNFTITNTSPSSGGTVTGTGTTNYIPKWSSSSALTDSSIFDNGTSVGIGTITPSSLYKLQVSGVIATTGGINLDTNPAFAKTGFYSGGNLFTIWAGNNQLGTYSLVGNIPGSYFEHVAGFNNSGGSSGTQNALRIAANVTDIGVNSMIHNQLLIDPQYIHGLFGTGALRGVYYNPTVTSLNGASHIAWENTSGDIIHGNLATGGADEMVTVDTNGKLKKQAIPTGGGLLHGTATGTDTYSVTITGPTSYTDGDAYLIRFTNGNTTGATLNINGLGAIALYRNNDGPLIGGDIFSGAEMLCVYNSSTPSFQCIGTSPNSLFAYVTNDDSVTITKGQAVYAFSGTGDRMTVKRALNTSDATSAQTVGIVYSTSIAANQKGFIMMQGLLDGLSILPTATWSDGDPVYLGATAGSITNVKPYAPNHLVYLGVVTTASNGSAGRMYVRVQNGYELDELHNVQAQTPTLKDTLWYDNTVSPAQWKTASISTILGYTPIGGTGTTNELAYFTASTTLGSLTTATYPSLTELSYVKGVTSAIQTQLNTKGYTLGLMSLASNMAAGATYYFGNQPRALLGTATNTKVFIPKTGTIKRAEITSYASTTVGTAQNISVYVRLNNTTDTLVATVGAATAVRDFTNTALNIAVVAGDYIEIKVVVATPYTTPPAGITFGGNLYIE